LSARKYRERKTHPYRPCETHCLSKPHELLLVEIAIPEHTKTLSREPTGGQTRYEEVKEP